jgi:hypothetical protein
MGWSSGTFGLFDLRKEEVPKPALNYVGVIAALVSIVIYVFVKTDVESTVKRKSSINEDPEDHVGLITNTPTHARVQQQTSWVDKLTKPQRKIFGIFLSVVSGILYGVNFDPPQYLMDHGHSKNGLDYVFSHFCGIYLTSTFFMALYCALKKNKPAIYSEAILPAFLSGSLWAVAQICWFIANTKLDLVVAFPIISTGPGVIASLWGVLVFKEIKGTRNLMVLGAAFTMTIVSVILITLSKVG